jgi:tetratricopeptide (TPR) repeat protein
MDLQGIGHDLTPAQGDCHNGPELPTSCLPVFTSRTTKFLYRFFILGLLTLGLGGLHAAESDVEATVRDLQAEWAEIFYTLPKDQHAARFKDLLAQVHAVSERYPKRAEPLILEAIILCGYARAEIGLGSLGKLEEARRLLEKSITLDPRAMGASAYITLGNLYHRLPGWPLSYGDDDSARQYFEAALKLFPEAIDANYFYGDFLLSQGEYERALGFLEKAARAPIGPDASLSERKLKEEIGKALADARAKNAGRDDFFSRW